VNLNLSTGDSERGIHRTKWFVYEQLGKRKGAIHRQLVLEGGGGVPLDGRRGGPNCPFLVLGNNLSGEVEIHHTG